MNGENSNGPWLLLSIQPCLLDGSPSPSPLPLLLAAAATRAVCVSGRGSTDAELLGRQLAASFVGHSRKLVSDAAQPI